MRKLILAICTLFWVQIAFTQSVVWETRFDFGASPNEVNANDEFLDLSVLDTSIFFSSSRPTRHIIFYGDAKYKPVVLKHNNRGIVIDTFVYFDTINSYRSVVDRNRRQLWMVYHKVGRSQRLVLQRIDLNGRLLQYTALPLGGVPNLDSMPKSIFKVIPASDGGFYIMATTPRTIASQSVTLWQVSRWDSVGQRKWVNEYTDRFVNGAPLQAEILTNGELMVSGWKGTEIIALHIDTSNGRQISRKVLFTNPRNLGWFETVVKKLPDGYFVSGADFGNPSQTVLLKLNDTLGRVWGGYPADFYARDIETLSDSSFWVVNKRPDNYYYERFSKDSVLLFRLNLTNYAPNEPKFGRYKGIGYFNDGSVVIGGDRVFPMGTIQNSDLVFMKVANFGTPYNPIYPPVGPVLTSNKILNQEPNLQVYPNPFTNTLRLSHKGNAQLLDVHGRVILSQPVEAGEELKVGNLPKGMYLLRLQSVGGKLYIRKVVRE